MSIVFLKKQRDLDQILRTKTEPKQGGKGKGYNPNKVHHEMFYCTRGYTHLNLKGKLYLKETPI